MAVDWASLLKKTIGGFTVAAMPPKMSLPALPLVVTQFIEKSNDPNVEIRDLARIIETDSGLTLELLKHVNSASVGMRTRVSSVAQAMMLLGLLPSRNLLIAVGVKAAVHSRQSRLINQSSFWTAALQKAIFAREIARMLKADPEMAFNGALLQDYLLPVVTNELYDQYIEFIKMRDQRPIDIYAFEQQTFGWDHALAGACLAHRWKLPDELVCCLLLHHVGIEILADPNLGHTPVAAVALSALLPDQLRQCYQGLEQLLLLEQSWPAFNLREIAEKVDAIQEESGLGMRNDFPLARRCKLLFEQCAAGASG